MSMKTLTLAVVSAVSLTAIPAFADGDWTGAYGGLSLGKSDISGGATLNGDDVTGGLSLGHDVDLGDWVIGGGFDYDVSDISLGGGNTLDSTARLKLRAGYDLGQGLVYATAGAARFDTSALGDDTGYFAGIGYEHLVTDQISVGGEILYHEADNFASSGSDLEAATASVKVNFRF